MTPSRRGTLGLADALRAEGGALAQAVREPAPVRGEGGGDGPGPPQLAASGPRAAGREADYELLLEMILEGSLLHYGTPRVIEAEDPDLALLFGDRLYALGLSRLAELGDLDAVAELADLISMLAAARAAGDGRLADAIWSAGARAIGWGASHAHETAKARVRTVDAGARAALQAASETLGGFALEVPGVRAGETPRPAPPGDAPGS